MLLVDNRENRDPAVNLALEEFLLRRFGADETLLLLYVNAPAVVIGRNQVPFVETALQEACRRQTVVLRRISGGGAVYHGPGNLNVSLIQTRRGDPFPSPSEAVRPVLEALRRLGVPARANARHDILIGDRKVTGTAQYRTQDQCLTHGTLLVSADLHALERLLTTDCRVTAFRGRRSIRSKVTNVARHAPAATMTVVRRALIGAFVDAHGPVTPLELDARDWSEVRREAQSKYRSWAWCVGRSPAFTIHRQADFSWGGCAAAIDIRRGVMRRIELSLPKGAPTALTRLAAGLEGAPYHPRTVARTIGSAGGLIDLGTTSQALAEWLCPSWFWWH